jgi:hypothetical protein
MGPKVQTKRKDSTNFRQIIVGRYHRVLYEYESTSATVFVLAVQHTRQKLPPMRDLRRE